ncbi:hypothetical protein P7H20_25065 [Paenibacillus larvae]|nr:hypothetical protein [Paenibacillus larvae]MDT2277452.1 hypothetical protein [Paenibacillus larvae]
MEIESIKRHLEQLKSQLIKINSYHGWLYVWTQDETMVFMDITIDSELRALIKGNFRRQHKNLRRTAKGERK